MICFSEHNSHRSKGECMVHGPFHFLCYLQITILDVMFHQFPGPVVGIVTKLAGHQHETDKNQTKMVAVLFHTKTESWKLLTLMLDLTAAPPPQQDFKLFFQLATTEFYLYNKHSVYIAKDGGKTFLYELLKAHAVLIKGNVNWVGKTSLLMMNQFKTTLK